MNLKEKIVSRLSENFPALARFKKTPVAAAAEQAADDVPGGIDLKPEPTNKFISKKIITMGVAGLSVVLLAGYYGFHYSTTGASNIIKPQTDASGQAATEAGKPSGDDMKARALKEQQRKQAAGAQSAASGVHGSSPEPDTSTAPVAAGSSTTANKAAANQQEQQAQQEHMRIKQQAQQSLSQALSGGGAGGGGWSGSGAGGTASAEPSHAHAGTGIPSQTTTAISKPNSQSGLGVYDTHLVRKPASQFELMQGSVIGATLTTGIESDLPGQISAIVAKDVYDSSAGAHLLIPAGAQLVGEYSNKILPGQQSVAIAWNRIIFPNGSYLNLGSMPGTDPNGMSGLSGDVNNHMMQMFKAALLLSLVETGMTLPGNQQGAGISPSGMMSPSTLMQMNMMNTFGQAVSQLLERYINVSPTIEVQPGTQLAVVVSKDLVFAGEYDTKQTAIPDEHARDVMAPAMRNPYPETN